MFSTETLPESVLLRLADLPVAAVLTDQRGKLLAATPLAAPLLLRIPELLALASALATRAVGSTDLLRHGSENIRLTLLADQSLDQPDSRVVFLIAEPGETELRDDRFDRLTPRQRETAQLAATGLRTSEIAVRLGCTERTVRSHLGACYHSLGIRSRAELAALVANPLSGPFADNTAHC